MQCAGRDTVRMKLPDVLGPDLRVVFCGTAAGAKSAAVRAYYAGPGNQFWPTLHEVGFTSLQLRPTEFRSLLDYSLGLTDVCKVAAGSDREVDGQWNVPALREKLQQCGPGWLAFNGKKAAEVVLGRPVGYGRQPETLGATGVFVLPSTSGAARKFWTLDPWRELAQLA
jgi:double-stranded uracil-DNA glycosylase